MTRGLIFGQDNVVAAWAFSTFKIFPTRVDRAVGIVETDGTLIGAFLLENFNGYNIELSYYGPWTTTPGIVRSIARMALHEFDPARATVITSKRNKRLIKALLKFGWRVEGIQRCFYGKQDTQRNTGVRLVMFRDQIEYIAGVRTRNAAG